MGPERQGLLSGVDAVPGAGVTAASVAWAAGVAVTAGVASSGPRPSSRPSSNISAREGWMYRSVGKVWAVLKGLARRGVTMNINSDFSVWNAVLRKRAPSTGMSPSKGMALTDCETLLLIKPPIAKLSPSRNWTVVDARRVVIDGNRLV